MKSKISKSNDHFKKLIVLSAFIVSFQNCSQVEFGMNYNTLASLASSSGPLVSVNGGRPSNRQIMSVAFRIDELQSQTGAKFTSMRLGMNRESLNQADYIPFANPTTIDLQSSFASDGSKDGVKEVYVDINVEGSATPMSLVGQLTLDTLPPEVQFLSIENGASATSINYTNLQIQAKDSFSNITQVCFKTRALQPKANDLCWTPVTQLGATSLGSSLNLAKAPFLIGFVQAKYTVYAYVQDEAGNISKLRATGAGTDRIDKKSIQYNPPIPPVLINVFASNTDHASFPPKLSQLKSAPGDKLYIKWKVASAPGGLDSHPIRLFFTKDEKTYKLIDDKLENSSNGGCALDANFSGCYIWTTDNETDKYFRIRVGVQDKNGQLTFASTLPVNSGTLNVLAGNTDPGLDGSAASAMFYNANLTTTFYADPQSFVITQFGVIVFRDSQRGLLMIDPHNGIQKLIVPLDGEGHGHSVDGELGTATLGQSNSRLALDYSDRVLIADKYNIRVLDLQNKSLTSLIGVGPKLNGSTLDGTLANNFNFSLLDKGGSDTVLGHAIFPLPNGDLVFKNGSDLASVGSGAGFRIYKAADRKIYSWVPSGMGANRAGTWDANWALADANHTLNNFAIGFEPFTSQITNLYAGLYQPVVGDNAYFYSTLDPLSFKVLPQAQQIALPFTFGHHTDQYLTDRVGNMTAFSRWDAKILQFDAAKNIWQRVLGTGILGQCPDGTPALQCNVDLQSVFIGPQNQIYFADRGRIRTISDDLVFTIIGQSYSFGDGGLATSARFGLINYIDQDQNKNIVVLDSTESRIRRFPAASTISTIAGNGTAANPDTSQPATSQPLLAGYWGGLYSFAVDSSNGDLYLVNYKLDASTGKWQNLYGSSVNFANADGKPASAIQAGYPWATLGFGGGKLLQASNNWTYDSAHPGGWLYDSYFKLFDSTNNYVQSTLAGSHNVSISAFGSDGDLLNDVQVPTQFNQLISKAYYDAELARWYALRNGDSSIKILQEGSGQTLSSLVNLPRSIGSFTYLLNNKKEPIVYYCSKSGRIYKYNINLKQETQMDWASTSIDCQGNSIVWNSDRSSIVFPFSQNALSGVAEIVDTP